MSNGAIVVPPGEGHRAGNTEFLARTVDTPRFNLCIIDIVPGRVVEQHVHAVPTETHAWKRPPLPKASPPTYCSMIMRS